MKFLVLTSIYPGADTPKSFTPVVHYFVREWVKMGYEVRVIHACTYFPGIYYRVPRWLKKIIQNRIGIALPEKRLDKEIEYEYEGVRVYRIPMWKMMPMGSYSDGILDDACQKAERYIQKERFMPEHIISHWPNPQLVLMSHLKAVTGAVTTMVLHGAGPGLQKPFKNWNRLIADVDIWGYRAEATREAFESAWGKRPYSFRCFSGIPDYYLVNTPQRDGSFHNRFVQVSLLIERKNPGKAIEALLTVYGKEDFSMKIVGEGNLMGRLTAEIEERDAKGRIHLLGRLPRQEIIPILDASDVFILISEQEVFGLAYIEAMARGCIVIASRGEGMEGVIEHGVNGFFCEAGNAEELASVITMIRHLTASERRRISEAAIRTSRELTDVAVARNYIESVIGFGEKIKKN